MTPERWRQVKAIFSAAIEKEPADVRAFIEEACAGDADLRAEVESLLLAGAADHAVLDRPAAAHVTPDIVGTGEDRWIGRRIGAWQIVALLGRGGMGDVYRARRVDAEYEKEVAIKLVPGGFHATYVLQRFRAERQILASLEHPNIARLIDGGVTEEGAPYLVMELVEGVPLDRYVAERGLGIRERLSLMLDVCAAVTHAHRHLVVHRDLKPGNILVTSEGRVKLLDFGIAKLLQPANVEAGATPTVTLMRTLTPGYSSPEQILGKPITTASDIYSLGVVLYVLLTGRSPYRRALDTAEDAIHEVCDTEPLRPSVAAAGSGGTAREPLGRDVDAIILRALRKEPERRYASVDQLAEDIRRHLEGRPVLARGDDAAYRAGRFVRRHRLEVAAAAALVAVLVGATVVSLREARMADEQRARAERHFASVRGLANAFMFDVNDQIKNLPGATRAREVLLGTALKYLDALAQEAGDDTALRLELATAFGKVADVQGEAFTASKGQYGAALESYEKAVELLEPVVAAQADDTDAIRELARISWSRAELLLQQGYAEEALANSTRAVELLEPLAQDSADTGLQGDLAGALRVRALTLFYTGAPGVETHSHARRAVALYEDLARQEPDRLQWASNLSTAYSMLADSLAGPEPDPAQLQEMLALQQKALAIDERLAAQSGGENSHYLRSLFAGRSNVAFYTYLAGDPGGALRMLEKAREVLPKLAMDPDNSQALVDSVQLAWHEGRCLFALGRVAEAERVWKASLEAALRDELQRDNLQFVYIVAATQTGLGSIAARRAAEAGSDAQRLGRWKEARDWYARAIPGFERVTSAVTLDHRNRLPIDEAAAGLARSLEEIARLSPAG